MKQYNLFISKHHDFDVHTGIATYLSSLVIRSEVGVFQRILETMKKNASTSSSFILRAWCGETVFKNVKTEHRMALYASTGTHAQKNVWILHRAQFAHRIQILYQQLLQSAPVQAALGFKSALTPVVIRGNYKMDTAMGVLHRLADVLYKTVKGSIVFAVESSVSLCSNSNTGIRHNMAVDGNIGRVNLIDHVRLKYDAGVSCSVTPLYVSLRTLGDMSDMTLGTLQPMTLEEVQIKKTL